jgi:hypothetical protein
MKKIFIIILTILIGFTCLSQEPHIDKEKGITRILKKISHIISGKAYIDEKGDIIIDDRNYISGGDASLLSNYNSNNVTKTGLTYNSTGDTIVSVSDNIVVIDGYDDAVVGNSIRFGDPESETIYTILSIDGDELTLDQTCTGNIGDEFFIGCDGLINDQSIYDNDGVQTIGAYQAKNIWTEIDSSSWLLDGVDDYYLIDENGDSFGKTMCNNGCAISFWAYPLSLHDGIIVGRYDPTNDDSFFRVEFFPDGNLYNALSGDGTTGERILTTTSFSVDEWIHIVMIYDGSTSEAGNIITYKNGSLDETSTGTTTINSSAWEDDEDVYLGVHDETSHNAYFDGYFDEVYIYKRTLTTDEITELYENSKHYKP